MTPLHCRFCSSPLSHTFTDLGSSPLANAYIGKENLNDMEPYYPLHAYVCAECFLVQLGVFETPEKIFGDYAYFSSFSDSWLTHCKDYVEMIVSHSQLTSESLVIELASNDGYLLQYFQQRQIPVLGIEPAANVAKAAIELGIPTRVAFFGADLAKSLLQENITAELIIANNVLAHVPDLRDFVSGIKYLLKPQGIATIEVPHLLKLIQYNQFDTIYHEHFSYFSLFTLQQIFQAFDLEPYRVDELSTHGGSIRIYLQHRNLGIYPVEGSVNRILKQEVDAGLNRLETYLAFSEQVKETKRRFLSLLIEIKNRGKSIVAYGAPAKGNTLLNYCGIGRDFIEYTVDRNPFKQGKYLPGSRIPILHPEMIQQTKPDYVLILPWNIQDEIRRQLRFIHDWGGSFIIPIPQAEVLLK